MDEIMAFVRGIVQVDDPAAVISKFEELGVCVMDDLQDLHFESKMISCIKLIPARRLQIAVNKYFHLKSLQQTRCATPSSSSSTSDASDSTTTTDKSAKIINRFKIPYERFTFSLKRKMDEGERATTSETNEMIRTICDEVWEFCRNPGKRFCAQIANDIVNKYEDTFGDSDDEADDDSGSEGACDEICKKLQNRLCNMNREARKRKLMGMEEKTSSRTKIAHKDKFGTKNFLPSEFPPLETHETQNEKKIWLKMEYKKHKTDRNYPEIREAMKNTYRTQRIMIADHLPVNQIREEWPFLFEKECLQDHFSELMGFELVARAEGFSTTMIPVLLKYFDVKISTIDDKAERKAPQSTRDLRDQMLMSADDEPLTAGQQFTHAFLCLMAFWKKPSERFIKTYEANASYEEIQAGVGAPDHPHIAVVGDSIRNGGKTCYPMVAHNAMEEAMEAYEALLCCFAMYFVFAIQYPPELGAPLEFLQVLVLGIRDKGSKVQRVNGVRPEINSRVLTLINNLGYFKQARRL